MDFALTWDSTLLKVLLGASVLGLTGGVLGSFTLLKRQSLLGDALAHAALPGVCLAFLLTGSKSPLALFLGALVSGVVGALFVLAIARGSRVKEDSAIGIVLSVFFGAGIVLLTLIRKLPTGDQSGLDRYLFGQAATLLWDDVIVMAVVGFIVLALVALFYKELKLLTFDRDFGASLGFPMHRLEVVFTCLLVVVVVIGLQTVGVILMVAILITPAAAARQWTDSLGRMALLAGAIGVLAGAAGALASALPTGPTIVLASSLVLVFSLLAAPRRGLAWALARERRLASRIRSENLLKDVYLLGERQGDLAASATLSTLQGLRAQRPRQLGRVLRRLLAGGLLEHSASGWRLSSEGLREAERVVRKHRLWELYLTRRLDLPSDHVHRDAEAMEHALSDEEVAELEKALGYPEFDPHGRRIPGRAGAP